MAHMNRIRRGVVTSPKKKPKELTEEWEKKRQKKADEEAKPYKFECPECGRLFKTKKGMATHQEKKHKKNK